MVTRTYILGYVLEHMDGKTFFNEVEGQEFSKVVSFATQDSADILEEIRNTLLAKGLENPIIADYGGGTGDLLSYIQEGIAGMGVNSEAYNIDIDPTKLRDFKETENRYAVLANLKDIPVESGFFDIGLSRLVFQYLGPFDTQFNVLKEIYRTLKPGAILYLQVMYASDPENKRQFNEDLFKCIEEILIKAGAMHGSLNTEVLTEDEFCSMLAEVGFTSFKTLKSAPVPQSLSELRNRFKLSRQSYAEMVTMFDGFSNKLKDHLKVESSEGDRKYILPTLLIEATK